MSDARGNPTIWREGNDLQAKSLGRNIAIGFELMKAICKPGANASSTSRARNYIRLVRMVYVNRWDEKAGLQTGCCTLPSYRRALSTRDKGDRQ